MPVTVTGCQIHAEQVTESPRGGTRVRPEG